MKRLLVAFASVSLLFVSAAKSQAPLPRGGSLLSQLQAIQAANKTLLDQQQKTLQTLDEMKAAAEQIKAFGKRG